MTVIELRNQIIQRLQEINDLDFLEAVKTIIESKVDKNVFILNKEIYEKLNDRKDKVRKGIYSENEDVLNEADEWLKGK
jgi:hypothetical protein